MNKLKVTVSVKFKIWYLDVGIFEGRVDTVSEDLPFIKN